VEPENKPLIELLPKLFTDAQLSTIVASLNFDAENINFLIKIPGGKILHDRIIAAMWLSSLILNSKLNKQYQCSLEFAPWLVVAACCIRYQWQQPLPLFICPLLSCHHWFQITISKLILSPWSFVETFVRLIMITLLPYIFDRQLYRYFICCLATVNFVDNFDKLMNVVAISTIFVVYRTLTESTVNLAYLLKRYTFQTPLINRFRSFLRNII